MELEDRKTATKRSALDDEYAKAGVMDPKVCVTTSRDPSSRLKQFAKELKLVFPNAQRINRGNHKVSIQSFLSELELLSARMILPRRVVGVLSILLHCFIYLYL